MSTSKPSFLEPFTFARTGKTARNRVVLAAMTNKQSNPDGTLGEDEHRWLMPRIQGGFGVITTCAAHVSPDGQGWAGELGVFDDAHIPGLRRLATEIHAAGALGLVQIFHGGVRAPSALTGQQPWSASTFDLDVPGFEKPRAATPEDIARVIDHFAAAARRVAEAGFDGVELHGAHGYLFNQFLGRKTNTRTDAWGGAPLENRARLLLEALDAVRARVPADFLVGIRTSPELEEQGITLDESLQVARWLTERGIDFLHVSNWDSFKRPAAHPDIDRPLTTWFRNAVGADVPILATGAITTPAQGEAVMGHGADLIGLARVTIANPAWPREAARPGYEPLQPPLAHAALRERGLSDAFIEYVRRFGMVREA